MRRAACFGLFQTFLTSGEFHHHSFNTIIIGSSFGPIYKWNLSFYIHFIPYIYLCAALFHFVHFQIPSCSISSSLGQFCRHILDRIPLFCLPWKMIFWHDMISFAMTWVTSITPEIMEPGLLDVNREKPSAHGLGHVWILLSVRLVYLKRLEWISLSNRWIHHQSESHYRASPLTHVDYEMS